MTINYPTDQLVYYTHVLDPRLTEAVNNYYHSTNTNEDIPMLRDYLKHWISFPLHQFENEDDRLILLGELDQCLTPDDINRITDKLLDFGIDPF